MASLSARWRAYRPDGELIGPMASLSARWRAYRPDGELIGPAVASAASRCFRWHDGVPELVTAVRFAYRELPVGHPGSASPAPARACAAPPRLAAMAWVTAFWIIACSSSAVCGNPPSGALAGFNCGAPPIQSAS